MWRSTRDFKRLVDYKSEVASIPPLPKVISAAAKSANDSNEKNTYNVAVARGMEDYPAIVTQSPIAWWKK